jgi:hypothetical protein
MTPSQPIDDRSRRHDSRWCVTSNAAARDTALDSTPRAASILSPGGPLPTAHSRFHPTCLADQLLRLRRAALLHFHPAAKSP